MSRCLCRPNVSMSTVAESAAAAGRSTVVVYVHHAYFLKGGKTSDNSDSSQLQNQYCFILKGSRA